MASEDGTLPGVVNERLRVYSFKAAEHDLPNINSLVRRIQVALDRRSVVGRIKILQNFSCPVRYCFENKLALQRFFSSGTHIGIFKTNLQFSTDSVNNKLL